MALYRAHFPVESAFILVHALFVYRPPLTSAPGGSQHLNTDQKSAQSSHGDSMTSQIPYHEETPCPSWGALAYTLQAEDLL